MIFCDNPMCNLHIEVKDQPKEIFIPTNRGQQKIKQEIFVEQHGRLIHLCEKCACAVKLAIDIKLKEV
jgi:hypothetical protein